MRYELTLKNWNVYTAPCKSHNGADHYPRAVIKQLASSRRSGKRRNAETRDRIMRFSNRGRARGRSGSLLRSLWSRRDSHRSNLSARWPRER